MAKIGVLGVGNILRGDDGIGVVLVNRLKQEGFPEEVEFYEVGLSGMNILHHVKNLEKILIVDAVQTKGEPGDVIIFRPSDLKEGSAIRSSHGVNLLETIRLSEKLGEKPEEIVIMGIIPKSMSLSEDLSSTLRKKLPQLEEKLRKELNSMMEG